jgi:hypothetical protein
MHRAVRRFGRALLAAGALGVAGMAGAEVVLPAGSDVPGKIVFAEGVEQAPAAPRPVARKAPPGPVPAAVPAAAPARLPAQPDAAARPTPAGTGAVPPPAARGPGVSTPAAAGAPYVSTGVILFEEKPQPQPVRKAPGAAALPLKQRVEQVCGGAARDIEILQASPTDIQVHFRVPNSDEGKRLSALIMELPELAPPCQVHLQMELDS